MFKGFVKDLSDVPEEHRGFYKQVEGGYALQVEGMVEKSKVDAFRENNISLQQQLEKEQLERAALAKKYDGINLEEIEEMKKKEQQIKDRQLIDAGKVDELIEIKVAEARNKLKGDIDKLAQENDGLKKARDEAAGTVKRMKVERVLGDVALKHGVRESALEDVFNTAHGYGFQLSDSGDVIAMGPSGEPRRSLKDPTKSMTVDEYFTDVLPDQKSYYYKESGGGGAANGGGGGAGGRRVSANDQEAMGRNLADIASGKVSVSFDG